MVGNNKTFIKITNKDVYNRIVDLEKTVNKAMLTAKINAAVIAAIISILCVIVSRIIL